MTAYVQLVRQNPHSQFCTFYITNCGRSSYNGIQYRYVNNSTGYSSGWRDTYAYVQYWNGSWGYTSEFDISLSTGYSYSVYTRMQVGSTWYEGDYYYEPVSFYFTPPPPPPPSDRPSIIHHSSSGTTINMQVLNAYGATSIEWKTPWGSYTRSVYSTPYIESFNAPSYGTEYTIGAIGINSGGRTGEKLAYTMTEPRIPSISSGGSFNNTITVNISTSGGWDRIEVEMWDINATRNIATRTLYSGNTAEFGGLAANASYLFRAISYKTASYGGYSPNSGYGGWLTIKNEVALPTPWKWTTSQNSNGHKISGAKFSMLASEWNDFSQRINAYRKYRGLGDYSFTRAYSGNTLYFYFFNEAKNAIEAMNTTGTGLTPEFWTISLLI